MRARLWLAGAALATMCAGGCAPAPPAGTGGTAGGVADRAPSGSAAVTRPGTAVSGLDFLYAFENVPSQLYYPIEGLGGCDYGADGTLLFTDEKRGKVYGLEAGTRRWYEFDAPGASLYQPVDVAVDGFKVLVLDQSGGQVARYDLNGTYLDLLVDIRRVDPVIHTSPVAFAVDRDGRIAIADPAQQQVLLLDSFQNLVMRMGDPGTRADQFRDPSGLAFLPDGGLLVADRGNRRLAKYGRHGFFERLVGGDDDPANPFFAPEGLDTDRFGNVFVADAAQGAVLVLGQRLGLDFAFGREQDGGGHLLAPVDVTVGPGDLLAVADRERAAVLVYRILYQ